MDFALVDQALLAFMHEFDRILNGEDVFVFVVVDMVDHGGEGGGLAGASGSGHQHQATRHH